MGKLSLYFHTVKYLKPEQIIYRVTNKLGMACSLGVKVSANAPGGPIALLPQLDFDPVFLSRFPLEELMQDRISLLHESEDFDWNSPWKFENRTPLWNYNLHYFEYLLPLVHAWQETKQSCYLDKIREMIAGWIRRNPRSDGGAGWDAYPLSLRLISWLSCYSYLESVLDAEFRQLMIASMQEQYAHLAAHLEKHLLGNHYFENLKTLVICSIFFRDHNMTEAALRELKKQCREQILPDGMHFELSPMYHKIILEDLLRTAAALRLADRKDEELEKYLQPMVDVAYSLEEGLERIPLFNDCGNNVAKSLDTLLLVAREAFAIDPQYKTHFPDSGYYIFKNGDWKLIVDAGQPGPDYLPGHAHCDAMSFELFHKGSPVLVNCGTYAYQCGERDFFRSTAAHNTVMRSGVEQSQCWGSFRMGKRSRISVLEVRENSIRMELRDQAENTVTRRITVFEDAIQIDDSANSADTVSYLHFRDLKKDSAGFRANGILHCSISPNTDAEFATAPHAKDFGLKETYNMVIIKGNHSLRIAFEG